MGDVEANMGKEEAGVVVGVGLSLMRQVPV